MNDTQETPSSNGTSRHEDRAHSELGGSSASRWSQCTGCVFLNRTLPPQPSSAAAKEGTKAHELAEVALRDFLNHKKHGTDPEIQFSLLTANYDSKMVEAAEGWRDIIWEKVLEKSYTGKAYGLEEHFYFDKQLDMGGTVDFWCIYINDKGQRVGAIIDFKFGYSYVEVKKNGQLAFYSAALRRFVREHGKDLDLVRAGIYQPRCVHHEAYRETVFSAKQLDTWENKFVKAAHQIYIKQKPTFKVGSWCQFCPAQAICPKYGRELSAKAELKILDVKNVELIEAENLSDNQLANVIKNASQIEAFLKSCKAYAINRHMAGKKLPGMKVVLGPTRRKWKENEADIGAALIALGVEDPWNRKLKGLGDIQRALGKGGKDTIAPYVTQTTAKPVLVSLDDERPEVENCLDLLAETSESED